MADIGPGTLVRCVKGFPLHPRDAMVGVVAPVVGAVYTIRDAAVGPDGDTYIRLVEIVNPSVLYGSLAIEPRWWISAFVPLDDSALDIFRPTSTDTPAKEPVAA